MTVSGQFSYFFNQEFANLYMKQNFWCNLLGHLWIYKDYTDRVNLKGNKYHFTEKRICHRCNAVQYKYEKWEEQLRDIDWEMPLP